MKVFSPIVFFFMIATAPDLAALTYLTILGDMPPLHFVISVLSMPGEMIISLVK